jgi:hypothetical protein
MTAERPNSARAAALAKFGGVCFGGEHLPDKAPAQTNQAEIVAFPRRAKRPRRARRLVDVHISAARGREPIGRTRPLRLTEADLAWLIATALRLEGAVP